MDKPNQDFEHGKDIRDRTFGFACQVVKFCQNLYELGGVARIMAPQILNCGTSVAAMLEEARAAESTRDFISKCCIALKESREAHVRLRVHETCGIGPLKEAKALREEADALVSIISAIVRNKRANARLLKEAGRRRGSFVKVVSNS